jgi:hypothetical protein
MAVAVLVVVQETQVRTLQEVLDIQAVVMVVVVIMMQQVLALMQRMEKVVEVVEVVIITLVDLIQPAAQVAQVLSSCTIPSKKGSSYPISLNHHRQARRCTPLSQRFHALKPNLPCANSCVSVNTRPAFTERVVEVDELEQSWAS